ncbi:MAG: methylated-DNA--[protein]-cysteine S-methyltransferase [Bacteroidales bacterium]|jgi:AraC family transcriptional regulator of adaptative response/methylated-DNA-[protein]-cysteine methyltransferase
MIVTGIIETPIGKMVAGSVKEGICLLEFTDRKMLNTEYKILARYLKDEISEGYSIHIENITSELEEYFEGNRKTFSVPLVFAGTDFQKLVWNELMRIPFGATRSYTRQAEAIGDSSSVRAVANANGMNKISIVVPCHRVIGENGHLTGYGGGLWRKKWLLDHEKKFSGQPVSLTFF